MNRFLFVALSLSFSIISSAAKVELFVELDPMGSFVAHSESVKGRAYQIGNGIKVQGLKVKMDSFKTGIGLRDRHMRDKYFKAKKFPYGYIVAQGQDGTFKGSLTLLKKKVPIEGTYKIENKKVLAEFTCKISDFGIDAPLYLGVGVDNEVKVKGEMEISPLPTKQKKSVKSKK
ncbi:MAG: hypothetical protein CL678_12835 [Bdellovibrionaceae bacterium]|nr:hypothetical protein [Pseudobdellovibrionaceae bacterium]|tara:strand:- start:14071 stop:14592 length:522 start_codon:yes stop_codon:yes gene_type:complete